MGRGSRAGSDISGTMHLGTEETELDPFFKFVQRVSAQMHGQCARIDSIYGCMRANMHTSKHTCMLDLRQTQRRGTTQIRKY